MMPRLSLLFLFAFAMVPFALATVWPVAAQAGILICLGVLLLALVDLTITPSLLALEIHREVKEVLSVGTPNSVKIWFTNRGSVPLKVFVHDEPPTPCSYTDLPFEIELIPNKHQYSIYHVEPHHRGNNRFRRIFLQMKSRLKLWTIYDERDIHQNVRIYPDIQSVHGVELLGRVEIVWLQPESNCLVCEAEEPISIACGNIAGETNFAVSTGKRLLVIKN